jgi:hypothetical protein
MPEKESNESESLTKGDVAVLVVFLLIVIGLIVFGIASAQGYGERLATKDIAARNCMADGYSGAHIDWDTGGEPIAYCLTEMDSDDAALLFGVD